MNGGFYRLLLDDGACLLRDAMLAGARDDFEKAPALRRREWTRFLDKDRVADMSEVELVVGFELGRQADNPLVEGVARQALHGHDDRLVHLVAHDAADLCLPLAVHL